MQTTCRIKNHSTGYFSPQVLANHWETSGPFSRILLESHRTVPLNFFLSRLEIEQARLLTLKAAHMMDTVGNKVSMIYVMLHTHDWAIVYHHTIRIKEFLPMTCNATIMTHSEVSYWLPWNMLHYTYRIETECIMSICFASKFTNTYTIFTCMENIAYLEHCFS